MTVKPANTAAAPITLRTTWSWRSPVLTNRWYRCKRCAAHTLSPRNNRRKIVNTSHQPKNDPNSSASRCGDFMRRSGVGYIQHPTLLEQRNQRLCSQPGGNKRHSENGNALQRDHATSSAVRLDSWVWTRGLFRQSTLGLGIQRVVERAAGHVASPAHLSWMAYSIATSLMVAEYEAAASGASAHATIFDRRIRPFLTT
jgi:hypothetical protein